MILGAILTGGRSSRFGSDKAAALLNGRALVDHAAAVLRPHVGAIVRCGRSAVGGTQVDDRPVPELGPLGGIAGALHYAANHGYASVLTTACDMPVVPKALIAAMVTDCPCYCADAPILAHWPADLGPALESFLTTAAAKALTPRGKIAELSIRRWADSIGARPIRSTEPIANINTPGDLAAL